MMHTAVAAWAGDAMTARMATFYAAHNEYLEQLLTTGILGLAAWLLLVAAHLRRGERSWNTPGVAPVMLALCSYLAQAVVSIRVSMVFPLVMLLFGALAALTAPELPQPAAPAHPVQDDAQMTLGDAAGDVIAEQLRAIDLNTITPLEAMRLLFELQQKARG